MPVPAVLGLQGRQNQDAHLIVKYAELLIVQLQPSTIALTT